MRVCPDTKFRDWRIPVAPGTHPIEALEVVCNIWVLNGSGKRDTLYSTTTARHPRYRALYKGDGPPPGSTCFTFDGKQKSDPCYLWLSALSRGHVLLEFLLKCKDTSCAHCVALPRGRVIAKATRGPIALTSDKRGRYLQRHGGPPLLEDRLATGNLNVGGTGSKEEDEAAQRKADSAGSRERRRRPRGRRA